MKPCPVHHWMLDEGMINIHAVCKRCGTTRIFRPSAQTDDWGAHIGTGPQLTTTDYIGYDPARTAASRLRGAEQAKQRGKAGGKLAP